MADVTIYGKPTKIDVQKKVKSSGWSKVTGLNYPLGSSLERGHFSKQTGVALVKANLNQLLLTEKGERVMLPDFGLSLRRFLFQPLDRVTFDEIQKEILNGIKKYAPRIKILRIAVLPSSEIGLTGQHAFRISLTVKILEEPKTIFDLEVKIG